MRSKSFRRVAFVTMIGMVVARPALSGECTIEITSPPKGDGVGKEVMVEGTAMIPTEAHLWVLAGVQGLKQWWPQGGGDSQIEDGQWTVLAFIGQEHDIGRLFRIAAIVVNEDTDNRLRQWVEEAPAKGYPPITFPSTFPGCPPVQVTVKKISH